MQGDGGCGHGWSGSWGGSALSVCTQTHAWGAQCGPGCRKRLRALGPAPTHAAEVLLVLGSESGVGALETMFWGRPELSSHGKVLQLCASSGKAHFAKHLQGWMLKKTPCAVLV